MGVVKPWLRDSEARLWQLIEERAKPGVDAGAVDRRIWDLFGERWAIVFTDLAGFSRRVADFGITHFLQVIAEKRRLCLPVVIDHDGILMKVEADSFLLLFRRPEQALRCALAMQRVCQQANARKVPEEQVLLCVGIGYGDILRIGDDDVYGAEVNAASKLGEDTAGADEVLITQSVLDEVRDLLPGLSYEELSVSIPGCERSYMVQYPKGPSR